MKATRYFLLTRGREDRRWIKDAWIEHMLAAPERDEQQSNGRVRFWARIAEADDRYLRVITLEDRKTVHNVFFDRGVGK